MSDTRDIFTFYISDKEKFLVPLPPEVGNSLDCCYLLPMQLAVDNKTFIIGKDILIAYFEGLQEKLQLALVNKLQLDGSIQKNIGYYWNQLLNEKEISLIFKEYEGGNDWVGSVHLLWETDSTKKYEQYATWLYNDKDKNIIFEVTPIYPETLIDREDPTEVKAYQAWMKNSYEPFFTRVISKATAFQWVDQAERILQLIKDNEEMLTETENDPDDA